jgi:hypothetical protein
MLEFISSQICKYTNIYISNERFLFKLTCALNHSFVVLQTLATNPCILPSFGKSVGVEVAADQHTAIELTGTDRPGPLKTDKRFVKLKSSCKM